MDDDKNKKNNHLLSLLTVFFLVLICVLIFAFGRDGDDSYNPFTEEATEEASAVESELQSGSYFFDDPLVIVNPYQISS